jgi:hypothetical protein
MRIFPYLSTEVFTTLILHVPFARLNLFARTQKGNVPTKAKIQPITKNIVPAKPMEARRSCIYFSCQLEIF